MDAFALAALPLLEYEPAFTLWWLRAIDTTHPTKEKEGYRAYLYGTHARLTASSEYMNWKLESMKTRGEWFERAFKRAREEKSREVDLAVEAEIKLLANVEAGLMPDGRALDGPAGEQSDGMRMISVVNGLGHSYGGANK
jgi:hypothetical protein